MTSSDDETPDDKFLDLPEQDDPPGGLAPLWAVRSNLLHERQVNELNHELAGDTLPRMLFPWTDPREKKRLEEKYRREQLAIEQALRDVADRQDRLLQEIEQEQIQIDERRREVEDNAIRLQDGRRVYADGERFRDGEGRVLTGSDEAEAFWQHEYRPDASTWQEKQDIERRAEEAKRLKDQILKDKQDGAGTPEQASQKLDGQEKDFRDKVQAAKDRPVGDIGSTDYMAEYQLSSAPAFNSASAGTVSADAKPKEDGSETADHQINMMPQPSRPGTFKP